MAVLYRHIRPDKNEVFYIGIGEKGRELQFHKGRNKYWKSIYKLNNSKIIVEILFENISWEEAIKLEKHYIALHGRKDLGKGTLCNLTDGGEGAPGTKWAEERLKKFKETISQKPHPMLGKKHSEEARRKISEAGKRNQTAETKEKISLKNKGKIRTEEQKNRMKIAQSKVLFKNIPLESREKMAAVNRGKSLSEEIRNKISSTLKGHSVSESTREKLSVRNKGRLVSEETKLKLAKSLKGRIPKNCKKVIDLNTNIIYNSISEASVKLGMVYNDVYKETKKLNSLKFKLL